MQFNLKKMFPCRHLTPIIFYLTILAITAGLKLHYSTAGSESLDWILRPTAGLVEIISGIRFEHEPLAGYLSRDHRAIIAPACAGVNFLIVAFCMIAFSGVSRLTGTGSRLGWLAGSLAGAYLATILVNALRIIISLNLYDADIYSAALTPRAVHRAGGVLLYFTALSGLYPLARRILTGLWTSGPRNLAPGERTMERFGTTLQSAVPFCWYLGFTLGVPLLHHRSLIEQPLFRDHAVTVAVACAAVSIVFYIARSGYRCIMRNQTKTDECEMTVSKRIGTGQARP